MAGLRNRTHWRTTGASAMLTVDLVANLIIGVCFLNALESLGGTTTFAMFGAPAAGTTTPTTTRTG